MGLIGIAEAARRMGVTTDGARTALKNAGIELVRISERAYAVDEAELAGFIEQRGGEFKPGRPRKAKDS